jgi:hypothetical protein
MIEIGVFHNGASDLLTKHVAYNGDDVVVNDGDLAATHTSPSGRSSIRSVGASSPSSWASTTGSRPSTTSSPRAPSCLPTRST